MSTAFPIPRSDRRVDLTATAAQTVFTFPYPVLENQDVGVARKAVGGTQFVVLTYGVDYTVAGAPSSTSATVTLTTPATAGQVYRLTGARVPSRSTSLAPYGAAYRSALETELDNVTLVLQELRRDFKLLEDFSNNNPAVTPIDGTNITFIPSGASGVPRSVTAKLREAQVSIKDHGAIGDGSTDDTAAIRAAYAVLMAQGGGNLVAPRTNAYYRITDTINFDAVSKPFMFHGEGPSASRFKLEAASPRTMFYCGTAAYQDALKSIEDLSIIAPDTPCQGAGYRAIHFLNQGKPIVRHCSIDGGQNQIFIENTFATSLQNVVFTNSRNEALYFVNDKSANGSVIATCSFFANGLINSAPAIYIPNGDGTLIIGNDIEGNHSGIFFGGTSALSIIGNYIEVSTNVNIYCLASAYATIIEGNWLGASSAVSLNNMIGGRFTNNSIYNFAVTFGATSQDIDCANNYVSGTGSVGPVPFKAPAAYANSWAAGSDAPGYMKKSDGLVVLRGELTTGTPPSTAFTLPVGYRPAQTMYFATLGGGGVFGSVCIQSSGAVIPQSAPSGSIRLDGVSFNV